MLCRDWCLVKASGAVTTVLPLYCNSWTCEVCAPRRKRRLVMQAKSGRPNTFLTLTVNPAVGTSPDDRAAGLARAWRIIRKRAMRRYGYRRLPFIAIFEATKRGEPHLHILCRVKWLDQRWLSNQMRELMAAPMVDIRRIHGQRQIANYVAKYVGKDPHRYGMTKRYWTSQDWTRWRQDRDEANEPEELGWQIVKMRMNKFVEMMTVWGWEGTLEGKGYQLRRSRWKPG